MLSPGKAASINARQWLGGVGSGCQWGHVRAAFPAQVSVPGCWRRAELVPGGIPLLLPALCLGSHSWLLYTCFSANHFAELSYFCGMSHCCSTIKHPDLFYEIKREGQEVASPPLCSQVCPCSGFCRWNPSISNIRLIMSTRRDSCHYASLALQCCMQGTLWAHTQRENRPGTSASCRQGWCLKAHGPAWEPECVLPMVCKGRDGCDGSNPPPSRRLLLSG